ncbi:hypothetical protein [Salinilacihabitans rarus]|uniref:hypothetical protein n=1 Tax=Salinilacihabitans rarus TaxID=2961596 RepID=UPI0020C92103|nr:hypothetical protein [Salinilacihabitans rarus]
MNALRQPRRRVLGAGAAAVAALLAGCSDVSTRDPPEDEGRGPPDDAITDPAIETLRADGDEPIVRPPDEEAPRSPFFLTDAESAAAVEFDREPAGTDDARAFLEEADYDDETVVVYQGPVDECFERRVDYLVATEDDFDLEFCWVMRPATVACEAGRQETQSTFVRVPYPYDQPPTTASVGEGSSCRSAVPDEDAEGRE